MLFKYLVSVMIAITEGDETYGQMNWDSKTVIEANGLLKYIQHSSSLLPLLQL